MVRGDPIELAVILAAFYGLRRSEVVGLKWDAIDFEKKTFTVKHTVTQVTVDGKEVTIQKDRTKTKSSYRTLPLVPPFEELLHRLRQEQLLNQKVCGNAYCQKYLDYIYVNAIVHRHVGEQLTVINIVGGFRIPRLLHDLLHAHAVVIILERYARAFRAHLLELATRFPSVAPRPVVGRVADCIVGNRLAVIAGQLVLPVAVAVGVGNCLNRRADCTRGIGIPDFGSDVPAAVVVVHPGCILMRIVCANQLTQRVVLIRRGQITALFAGDVSAGVVGIFEGDAVLRDLFHQHSGAVRTISAVYIFVGARQLSSVRTALRYAGGDSAQCIIGIVHLVRAAIVGNPRHTVVPVLGKLQIKAPRHKSDGVFRILIGQYIRHKSLQSLKRSMVAALPQAFCRF